MNQKELKEEEDGEDAAELLKIENLCDIPDELLIYTMNFLAHLYLSPNNINNTPQIIKITIITYNILIEVSIILSLEIKKKRYLIYYHDPLVTSFHTVAAPFAIS